MHKLCFFSYCLQENMKLHKHCKAGLNTLSLLFDYSTIHHIITQSHKLQIQDKRNPIVWPRVLKLQNVKKSMQLVSQWGKVQLQASHQTELGWLPLWDETHPRKRTPSRFYRSLETQHCTEKMSPPALCHNMPFLLQRTLQIKQWNSYTSHKDSRSFFFFFCVQLY